MRDYNLRTLIIEKNTEVEKKAIEIMNNSRLPYELIELSHEEAEIKTREENYKIPKLLTNIDLFDNIDSIEWYAKVYGINGKLYNREDVQKPVIGISNKHFMQYLPSEYLFNLNSQASTKEK